MQRTLRRSNYRRFSSIMNFNLEWTSNRSKWKTRQNKILKQKTTNIHIDMKKIWLFVQKNFDQSQQNQKKYANKNKKMIANYESKNKMWLLIKKIKTKKSSKKLNDKQLSFFKMLKLKKNNVKLDLSNFMKIHNNFHIFLFRKNPDDFLFDQQKKSSFLIVVNNEDKWKIDDILNFRKFEQNKKLQYKAKWMNYFSNKKWYDAENFSNAKKIITEFHVRYFNKSKWNFNHYIY